MKKIILFLSIFLIYSSSISAQYHPNKNYGIRGGSHSNPYRLPLGSDPIDEKTKVAYFWFSQKQYEQSFGRSFTKKDKTKDKATIEWFVKDTIPFTISTSSAKPPRAWKDAIHKYTWTPDSSELKIRTGVKQIAPEEEEEE